MKLIIEDDQGRKTVVPIVHDEINIGRNDGNLVRLTEKNVSRKHARLVREQGHFYLEDLDSFTGVRVNGDRIKGRRLVKEGDLIRISEYDLSLQAGPGEGKPAALGEDDEPTFVRGKSADAAPGQGAQASPKASSHADTAAMRAPGREARAQAQTPPLGVQRASAGRSKGVFIGLGVLVAIGLVAGGVLVTRHRAAPEDDGIEVGTDSKAERRFALRAADEAARDHRFSDALRNLEFARNAGATLAELKDYEQIKAESRSEALFHEMDAAAASQDWERARKLLGELKGLHTYYGAKAAEKAEAITAGYANQQAQAAPQPAPDAAPHPAPEAAPRPAPQAASLPAPSKAAEGHPKAPPVAAASLAPVPKGDDKIASKLIADADQKLAAQDFAGAVALYQKALALRPSSSVLSGLYRSMGVAYTRQGNIEEGARYYRLYLPLCANPSEKAQLQKFLDDYEARRRG